MISVPEDAQNGDLIHTFTSDFGQAFVIAGADRIFFNLNTLTGELRLAHDPDFVTNPIFNVYAMTTAYNINSVVQAFTVNITDATPPVISLNNIDVVNPADTYVATSGTQVVRYEENTHIDQRILTVSSTDNSGSSSISLGGDSHPAFYLTGNDLYIDEMDAESDDVYFAYINSTDAEGNVATQNVWVYPYQVDDTAPYFTSSTLANAVQEHTKQNHVIYDANAYDPTLDDTNGVITYSISNDYSFTNWLSIDSSTGQVTLLQDVEYDDSLLVDYNILVEIKAEDDSGNFSTQTVTIPILERDHTAPVITSALSSSAPLDENNTAGIVVHTVTANETVTFEKTSSDGLEIDSTTGEITLPLVADYETKSQYYISYRVRDTAGNVSAIDMFTLTINDVFEDVTAPVITSTNPITVSFNEGYQGVLHTVTWTEEHSTAAITKTGGDLDLASNGQVTFSDPLDYEVSASHYVEFDITDEAGNTTSGRVDVTVGDVDDFPVISNAFANVTSFTINSVLSNYQIGAMSADKNVTWSFLKDDGTYATSYTKNNTTFTVDSNGNVKISTNGYIDVVGWNGTLQYTIAATADDDGQITTETYDHIIAYTYYGTLFTDYTSFDDSTGTLTVSIPENTSLSDVIGSITVKDYMDEPIQDECTFTITSGDLSGKFNWVGNELKLSSAADYETKSTYSGNVLISHPTAVDKTLPIQVTITNVDENAPVFSNGATHTLSAIPEMSYNGAMIYGAFATDTGDGTDGTVTYSLDSDPAYNSDKLNINSQTGQIYLNANVPHNAAYLNNHVLEFKVIATDNAGNTAEQVVGLPITLISPSLNRATGGDNDTYHTSGDIFSIAEDITANKIACYQVTNVADKGVTNFDLTFSMTGETTGLTLHHATGTDFCIIHNNSGALGSSDPQKVITLTATYSDGSSSSRVITINVTAPAFSGFNLNQWHSVTTHLAANNVEAYSVLEVPYDIGTGGTKRVYLEHKATANTAWQSDISISFVQIVKLDGSVHHNIYPVAGSYWQSASHNSATTVPMSSIGNVPFYNIASTSGSTNSGLGRFYIGSSTPSGTTGANDGISNMVTYNPNGLTVGTQTHAQASGTNFLYRECSSPVAHNYVNYARSNTISNLPAQGYIRIAYLNYGGTGLDGADSLRVAIGN